MQLSFFDHAMVYQGGKKSMKFLNEMKELIPFDAIEKILIEKKIYKPNNGKAGRPSIPAKTLIGALFLQNWYGLSDPMTEELINDRISFRKFLDIKDEDTIPDETTICKFRNALIKEELLESIFFEVRKVMENKKLILNEGTLIDATLIHCSEPKKKKDDQGNVISNEAYDKEATYTSKRGHKHHGHKMHIATDTNGIIKDVVATTASNHDSTQFDKLTKNESKAIFADVNDVTDEDYYTEYNDYIMAVKVVDGIDEAIEHINKYNTKHSEAIVTNNYEHSQKFLNEVDAAAVYVNASTRFTDGFEFGFGAEIGISTQKMHARGPMGLEALTSIKYIIYGDGQIRE